MIIYSVTADHAHPSYRFTNHKVIVRASPGLPGKFYAIADKLGCSKDYSSPVEAATAMFNDNACYSITAVCISED